MYGTRDFVAFYVSAAIISTLCWAISDRYGVMPGYGGMIGASGAVMAVVVVYTLYYPRREVLLFIFPVEMWLLLVIYLAPTSSSSSAPASSRSPTPPTSGAPRSATCSRPATSASRGWRRWSVASRPSSGSSRPSRARPRRSGPPRGRPGPPRPVSAIKPSPTVIDPRGSVRGEVRRDPRQDRPGRPGFAQRGGKPYPRRGQPACPEPAERADLTGHSIREAGPDDLDVIVEFNARLAHESEGKLLDRAILARGVAAALRDRDRLRYWVAEVPASAGIPRPAGSSARRPSPANGAIGGPAGSGGSRASMSTTSIGARASSDPSIAGSATSPSPRPMSSGFAFMSRPRTTRHAGSTKASG